jgi:hypothetical protein
LDIFQALHDSEIRAGLTTEPLAGFAVWIEQDGHQHETRVESYAGAVAWLHMMARTLYPESPYAQRVELHLIDGGYELREAR